jgi:hypothetical protein
LSIIHYLKKIMQKYSAQLMEHDKVSRGNSSQFFVAGELCRRGHAAVVTLGNTPNTDILCSNSAGTKFAHIQVKTFVPRNRTCSVGQKAERDFGSNFFWVLGGIPHPDSLEPFEYYIIPSSEMARNIKESHERWLATPSKDGGSHKDCKMRTVYLPPYSSNIGWNISQYLNRWDLIGECLNG